MQEWFALASGVIVLAGAPFYLYDIVKGTTKPHRITWLIWSIQGVVAFTSQALLGGHWSPSLLLYPVYLAVSCYAVLFVMLTRRTLRPKS